MKLNLNALKFKGNKNKTTNHEGDKSMNPNPKLMEVKGVKTPCMDQPKGEAFEAAAWELDRKVRALMQKKNSSVKNVEKLKGEINLVKYKLSTAEDPFEISELKRKKRELEDELELTEDLSHINIDAYRKELINNPEFQSLLHAAKEEYLQIRSQVQKYQDELVKQYNQSYQETQNFIAGYGSDASYHIGRRVANLNLI